MTNIPEHLAMLTEIINSTWPACTAPDPEVSMTMMMMIIIKDDDDDHHHHHHHHHQQEDDDSLSGLTRLDLQDPAKRTFIADAIISNPVTYGHIH
jgi:hypothetical protein